MNSVAAITFDPLLPWPALAVLGGLALAAWGVALWRGARGVWARLVPLAALLAALADPRLVAEERRPLPEIALVVADESLSQTIGDRAARTEEAVAALTERLARLPGLEVRVERVRPEPGTDEGTRLFAAVERALADVPRARLAGIVAVTDGQVHDVPADAGNSLGAPFHALLTGRKGERDRRIELEATPGYGLVGKSVALKFKVSEPGASGEARVRLRVDGDEYLDSVVTLNRSASVEVPVRHAGQTVVELEADPGPEDLSAANNRAALGINGVRDRLKVLLVSGEPHAGERVWRNLLKADPSVDLVHFTILRPPDKDDRTPIRELALITFPVRELFEERLKDFDLVVLDRYRGRGVLNLGYYQSLADYVQDGGALLAAVGPEFADGALWDTPLGEILPARPTGSVLPLAFRPEVSETGRRHPVTAGLPGAGPKDSWGSWARLTATVQERGRVLLNGPEGRPLLVLDKVGEGRVALVLSDTIWLWARGFEGGGPHDELLRRLAHWLMKEPGLEEESLSAEVKGGRLEIVRRSLDPAPVPVRVEAPDGGASEIVPADRGDGSWTASVPVDQPGLWRVGDGTRTAIAAAGSLAPLEGAEVVATADRLSPVAEATRGGVFWLSEGGIPDLRRVGEGRPAAGRGWIGLARRGEHAVVGLADVPLLPAALLLLAGLGGLLLAWRREGR